MLHDTRPHGRPGLTVLIAAVVLAVALGSCTLVGGPGVPAPEAAPPATQAPALLDRPDGAGTAWVEATLESLTLRERVAQLVFPWIAGSYAAADDPEYLETLRWVEEDGIGGVVISIGTPHAYAAKLNALQRSARVPLLVTSDFENGGPGMRIAHSYALPSLLPQGGGTSFPPTMAFGAIGDETIVERFAEATAREARAVGVHVVFAPVMDVNSNPENPIINTRAFGEDPLDVARLGAAFIRGVRRGGTLSTAKHFPGHGDTRIDSHLDLPEVGADRARLDAVELVPFRAAVAAGVDGVMTAHVSVPGVLGPGAPPATLAPEFMTGILRGEMGFEGLLFTDALRMGAITEGYGAGEAAVLAFEAGADVILVPASVPGAIEAMVAAVESGRITGARLDASVRRVLGAKARVGLHRDSMTPLDAIPEVVGRRAHRELADEAAERSITLVRDAGAFLPPDPTTTSSVMSVTWAAPGDLTAGREFNAVLGGLLTGNLEQVRVGPDTGPGIYQGLLERAVDADLVLLGVYLPPRAGAGSVALSPALREFAAAASENTRLAVISFGNPYLLTAIPDVGTYVLAWGDREVSQRAAARAVTGAVPISGRLPISIPPLHVRGEGLVRAADPIVAARVLRRGDGAGDPGDPGDPGAALPEPPLAPAPPAASGAPPPLEWLDLSRSPLETDPASVGMDAGALDALDAYVLSAIRDSVSPGVALAIGRGDRLVRLRGYGRTDWDPDSPPVTPYTLFDLASLTKVLATTSAIMALEEDGLLDLDAPVVRFLPDFARGDARKGSVTVRDLLLHRSGLPSYRQFFLQLEGDAALREAVFDLPLDNPPGGSMVYSDIGFVTLAWVVEAAAREPFERFLERRVFAPLGMDDTLFNPPLALRPRTAPTEWDFERRQRHMHGEVHDENAFVAGGIAGHAGLFSTAADLAVLARLLAAGGRVQGCRHTPSSGIPCARGRAADTRVFEGGTVERYRQRASEASSRALGWDTPSGRSSAGDFFSSASFGHTGFTGTSIWIDPELDLWVVVLTNRVNPTRANTRHIPFRRAVHDAAATAIIDRPVIPRDAPPSGNGGGTR